MFTRVTEREREREREHELSVPGAISHQIGLINDVCEGVDKYLDHRQTTGQ